MDGKELCRKLELLFNQVDSTPLKEESNELHGPYIREYRKVLKIAKGLLEEAEKQALVKEIEMETRKWIQKNY